MLADVNIRRICHHMQLTKCKDMCVREGPLIRALFEIRTMLKFRWVGGLEIRGRSNWRMKKKNAHPKNKYFSVEIQETLLEIKKEFYLVLLGNVNSFLRQVHKYIF